MIYIQLFYTFFKIGLFGFGGGYAMLSMIQGEVVTRYGWVSSQEFTDIVAISQMTPGSRQRILSGRSRRQRTGSGRFLLHHDEYIHCGGNPGAFEQVYGQLG